MPRMRGERFFAELTRVFSREKIKFIFHTSDEPFEVEDTSRKNNIGDEDIPHIELKGSYDKERWKKIVQDNFPELWEAIQSSESLVQEEKIA